MSSKYNEYRKNYALKTRVLRNEIARQWMQDHVSEERKVRAREYNRVSTASKKAKAHSILGSRCKCCGEEESLFLSLDHVANDGFKENIRNATKNYQFVIDNPDQTKFQLLCMNCNFGKRMNKGVCPHLKVSP